MIDFVHMYVPQRKKNLARRRESLETQQDGPDTISLSHKIVVMRDFQVHLG